MIISIANHKGGVAKTTLAVNVADALAREGLDVLVVDLDPQANVTALLYSAEETPGVPLEKVLDGSTSVAQAVIEQTTVDGVHLIGCSLKLANLERQLHATPFASTSLLSQKLAPVTKVYDVIILDTPPALSFLTANALAASDFVFTPLSSGSKLSLIGADDLVAFIHQAKIANPRLKFGGAVLTRHDSRKKVCRLVQEAASEYYERVLENTMPLTTDVDKGQIVNKTVLQLERDSNVSRAVVGIAREMMSITGLESKPKDSK
ncbi:ParA family protein [Propionivibrio dicarboxylicus]|uniref:Chromosome partitioning protein n=1 Tax=Propionivibrio dicarboxylicus TaxID=83767 RepID=A0A1G8EUW2_9RHOO|nr:ParA family protein [Propionivibrio dicarboxylicus]SDH73635.1 chromosome partitioning protein [Propionivibrio dicarboxylicus]